MIAPLNIKAKQKWVCLGKPDLAETLTRRRRSAEDFCKQHDLKTEKDADTVLALMAKGFSISNDFVQKVYEYVECQLQADLSKSISEEPEVEETEQSAVDTKSEQKTKEKPRKKSVKNDE